MSDYQKDYSEKKKKQLALWKDVIKDTFGEGVTETIKVTNKSEIIEILDKIGKSEAHNHTFMPSGGGLDLSGASYSNEEGLVELNCDGSAIVVKPESLTFHPIGDNPEWWYLRLDTLPFEATGIYEKRGEGSEEEEISSRKYYGEEVLEVEPNHYVDRTYWDMNHLGYDENGDEVPLPDHARIVTRKYNGGAFVTFPKYSAYNHNPRTYDGRHNKASNSEFEHYISKIVEELGKRES